MQLSSVRVLTAHHVAVSITTTGLFNKKLKNTGAARS